jgi:hypothetical protein
MLPPRLAQIKARIAAKPQAQRSTDERELLAELNTLDSDTTLQKDMKESFTEMRSFGPSGGVCTCCGR